MLAFLALAGCQWMPQWPQSPRTISLAEFSKSAEASDVQPGEAEPAAGDLVEAEAVAGGQSGGAGPSLAAGGEEAHEKFVPAGDEGSAGRAAVMEPGDRVIVDSLVGQVNGRPIFADEFFDPIEDQLIAEAEGRTRHEFALAAREIVLKELNEVVRNALFRAAAAAGLTPEQKQGLFYWFRNVQEQVIAGFGGTESQAEQQLAQEGTTLEAYMQEKKDRTLIRKLILEKLQPRIIVSWRDIETEYKRRYAQYHPPAKVTLARIRLSTTRQAEQVEQVKQRLAAGEPFAEIGESLNQRRSILGTFDVGEGGMTDIEIKDEKIRAQLADLAGRGDTTAPFEIGGYTWWIHVVELEQEPGRSLYDPEVQRELRAYLLNLRGFEEQNRYTDALLQKGIYDEIDEMAERLLTIAILRYGP